MRQPASGQRGKSGRACCLCWPSSGIRVSYEGGDLCHIGFFGGAAVAVDEFAVDVAGKDVFSGATLARIFPNPSSCIVSGLVEDLPQAGENDIQDGKAMMVKGIAKNPVAPAPNISAGTAMKV